MATIAQTLTAAANALEAAGVDSPRLNADLLLAGVLGRSRTSLIADATAPVPEASQARFLAMIHRRCQREPLQHLLGEAHFFGLVFKVTPDVLVPRPETELLVERAVEFLRPRPQPAVFDFGTGSGCISISIVKEVPESRVGAVDVSAAALEIATFNAAKNHVADRVEFMCGDGFAVLEGGRKFDLIVSNPPYIPSGDLPDLQPEVRDFDPVLALDGGADGLDFYRRLAGEAGDWLKPDGKLMIELGHDQSAAVKSLFENEMWIVEAILDDYSRIPRILIARRDQPATASPGTI